jgi:hypothetical protein
VIQTTEVEVSIKIDRSSIPRSYREYIEKLKSIGEMREIDDEVDWNLEQGAILRRTGQAPPAADGRCGERSLQREQVVR